MGATKVNTVTRTLAVNESVVYAELDDEAVLLNVETGIYFGLNPIGTGIWKALSEGADEGAIVDRLAEEYDVERAQLEVDVMEFLGGLLVQGLIRADGD
jgi:hypothetical protein